MIPRHIRHVATFGICAEPRPPFDATNVDDLVRVLRRTKMAGLALASISQGDLIVTEEQNAELIDAHTSFAAVELELDSLMLRTFDKFGTPGFALLKGAAHAYCEYPDPTWRQYGDLDIFATADRADELISHLESCGFSRLYQPFAPRWEREFGKSVTLSDNHLEVDVHRNLSQGLALGIRPSDVLARQEIADIASVDVPILDPPARLVHAAIHALGGSFEPPLNGMVDLAWMARDIERVRDGIELAREWGVPGTLANSLRLVASELGALSPNVWDLVADIQPSVRERLATNALARSNRSFRHDLLAGFVSLRDTRSRARYVRHLVQPRRRSMRN